MLLNMLLNMLLKMSKAKRKENLSLSPELHSILVDPWRWPPANTK